MIQKKKWIEILTQNNVGDYKIDSEGMYALIDAVDLLYTKTYRTVEEGQQGDKTIHNLFKEICDNFLTTVEANNLWADMPIWVSSYEWKNKAHFSEIILRLTQYLGFYKRILTDNGLARSVVTHRDYSDAGHTSGTNKGYNSETPQTQLENFDDAIKFASSLNKNEDVSDSTRNGQSNLTVDSKSWEEAEKNLKLIFYNDLCDYIKRIPQMLYREYSLSTMPFDAIVEETFKYFRDMYERR